jgi:stage III sporulation protein AG
LEEWIRGIKEETGEKFSLRGKKGRYLIVILVCLGLLALLWPTKNNSALQNGLPKAGNAEKESGIKAQMQAELETILSQVDGAGQVEVSLTLASDGLKKYAVNLKDETRQTEEKDYKGIERTINEQSTVQDLAVSGGDSLLVEQKSPEVVGVLVVAEGAKDPLIKEELTNITATLLNLSVHKVRVVARRLDLERSADQ